MAKKVFVLVLAVVMLATVFCGCNSEAGSSAASGAESSKVESSETESSEASSEASGETIEISFGTWKPEFSAWFEDPDNQPAELTEKGIKVVTDYSATDDYLSKLLSDIAAGVAPDVCTIPIGSNLIQCAPYLMDISEFAEADWGPDWKEKFNPLAFSLSDNYGNIGLPWGLVGMTNMIYNVDMFEELNLEYPKTMDDLIAVCKAAREAGYQPAMFGYHDAGATIALLKTIVYDLDPTKELWEKAELTGEASWTDPVFVEALNIYKTMYDEGVLCDSFLSYNLYMDAIDPFTSGNALISLNGTWASNFVADDTFRSSIDFEVMFDYMPDFNEDGEIPQVCFSPDVWIPIADTCKNPEAAWEVVKCVATGSVGETMYDGLTALPVYEYEADLSRLPEDEIEYVENTFAKVTEMIDNGYAPKTGYTMLNSDQKDALWVAIGDCFNGTKTAEEALASVEEVAKETRANLQF